MDRIFSDNKNYEVYCILCGDRRYVGKETDLGIWLTKMELARALGSLAG